MKKLVASLAFAAAITATSANAALVADGVVTRDTATGLEWLDLTATNGRTYADVSGNLVGEFAGWTYATATQVTTLRTNAGLGVSTDIGYGPGSPSFQLALDSFIDLFGDTFEGTAYSFAGTGAMGIYELSGAPGTHMAGGAGELFGGLIWGQVTDPAAPDSALFALDDDDSHPVVGRYLVRASVVPIPAAGWLLLSGVGAVAAIARRRRPA